MSLTVTAPLPGDPFGPGFRISVATDTLGPFNPSTSYWDIKLTDTDAFNIVVWRRQYAPTSVLNEVFISNYNETKSPSGAPLPETLHGATALLRIILVSSFTAIEDETVSVVLDREQGQVPEMLALMPTTASPAPTLTEEEHNAVLQTNAGVLAMTILNPVDLVGDFAHAIASSPPLGFGSLSGAYILTGDGEMPDIGDLLHTKLGIYFVATVIPAGLSHRHGQSEEYPARLVQWRTVHTVGGTEMVTAVLDFDTHGELLRWPQAKPTRIEYSILPGVTIAASWWQWP